MIRIYILGNNTINMQAEDKVLSMLTFWSMRGFLKNIEDSECNDETGHGYVIGVLKQDIGQAPKNSLVQLSNKEDMISISIKKEEEDENYNWKKIWKFHVVHHLPEIVDTKLASPR